MSRRGTMGLVALLLCGISMGVMGKFVFVSGGKE